MTALWGQSALPLFHRLSELPLAAKSERIHICMAPLLNLLSIQDQTMFNLDRWDEIGRDRNIATLSGRCETNRNGQVLLGRYLPFDHGARMAEIALQMRHYLPDGKATVECPISTSEGIKVADVVWISKARLKQVGGRAALKGAPEICVEVLSKSNTREEIEEKRRLYFEAGAKEVWLCGHTGRMLFFLHTAPEQSVKASILCPDMPSKLK